MGTWVISEGVRKRGVTVVKINGEIFSWFCKKMVFKIR